MLLRDSAPTLPPRCCVHHTPKILLGGVTTPRPPSAVACGQRGAAHYTPGLSHFRPCVSGLAPLQAVDDGDEKVRSEISLLCR